MEVWKLYVFFYNLQMLAVFEFTLPEIIRFPKTILYVKPRPNFIIWVPMNETGDECIPSVEGHQ